MKKFHYMLLIHISEVVKHFYLILFYVYKCERVFKAEATWVDAHAHLE